MEPGGRRGERVSLAVELFGDDANEFLVDALRAEVAGHFFDAEEARFGLDAALDVRPQVAM